MFILPLNNEIKWLNSNITIIDISIETWIQLIQNNFMGINDKQFIKERYKIECKDDLNKFIIMFKKVFKKGGIFVFFKDGISRELWYNINLYFKNVIIIGITYKSNITCDNIIIVNNLDNLYERDTICRHFNKLLFK